MRAKRIGAGLLAVVLVLGLLPSISAAAVGDVVGTRFEAAVLYLRDLNVVEGRPEGFFPLEPITRAEAAKITVLIVGKGDLATLLRGASSFVDVPSSHWASGYIAVAKNLGILNGFPDGTFRPDAYVTCAQYAKMLVEAAGLVPTPGLSWPANYIDAASRTGMLAGVTFYADVPAFRGDCAIMTAFTVKEVPDPVTGKTLGQSVFGQISVATVELLPGTANTAVGTSVTFTAVARDAVGNLIAGVVPTFSTSDSAKSVIAADGRFTATNAGTFIVTARVGTAMATATVQVYGAAVGLRATASPSSVVANGASTAQITVEVIDANGARVGVAQDAITIAHYDSEGAVGLPTTVTVAATNGTAVFTVTAGTLSGVTDTLRLTATGLTAATVSVRTIEPSPSSLRLTADPTLLRVNEITHGTVTAEVLDQAGQPMTFGTYYITFGITGKGLLEGGTGDIVVGTVNQRADVDVASIQGDAGSFTVRASASGLGSRSVSVTTYLAGAAKSIKVTSVDVSGEPGHAGDMTIVVGLYDANNRPTTAGAAGPITVEFAQPAGSGLVGLDDLVFNADDSAYEIDFGGTTAGKYTVTARDADTADPAVTSASFAVTVSATSIDQIAVSPSGDPVIYVPVSSPRLTLTAQLQDALDNDVAKSGVKLQFTATVVGVGAVTWSATDGKVVTDAAGRASIIMYGQPYVGNRYTVTVNADTDNNGVYGDATGSTEVGGIRVSDAVPADLTVTFSNPDTAGAITYLRADLSEYARAAVQLKDAYGNPIAEAGMDIEVTLSNEGRNVLADSVVLVDGSDGPVQDESYVYRFLTDADGRVAFDFQGGLAGTYTVTAKCLNVIPPVAKAASFRTTAGTAVANAMVLKTDNTPAADMSFSANRSIQVRLALTDNGGNPVAAPDLMTIGIEPDRGTGQYRLIAAGTAVTEVEFARGTAYRVLYYIDTVAGTGVDMYDDVTGYTAYALDLTWDAGDDQVVALVTGADGTPVGGISVLLVCTSGDGTFTGDVTEITGTTNSLGLFVADFTPDTDNTVDGVLVDGLNFGGAEVADTLDF